jgi:hypothetical protein
MSDSQLPPGSVLRDPAYQDLCAFFATLPDGSGWVPRVGDWVVYPPSHEPLLVVGCDHGEDILSVVPPEGALASQSARAGAVWLPALAQLFEMVREHFGTSGFFCSAFNNMTYWYTGQMLGMTVTNMQPLAEGSSPEEAAIKALSMRHQR